MLSAWTRGNNDSERVRPVGQVSILYSTSTIMFVFLCRKVFPNSFSTEVKVGGHDIALVGGISRRKANPSSTTLTSSAPDGSLKSSTPSHTTTTTSSLSSHLASKTAAPSSRATSPSPLLLSSRMSQQNQSAATTSASCETPPSVTRQNQMVSTQLPAISNITSMKDSSTSSSSSSLASSSNSSLSQQSINSLTPSLHTSTAANSLKENNDLVSEKVSSNGDLKVNESNLSMMNGDMDILGLSSAGKKRKVEELQSGVHISKKLHLDEIEENASSNGSNSLVHDQLNIKLPFVSSNASVSSTENVQKAKKLSLSQLDSAPHSSPSSRSVSPAVTRESTPESLHPTLPYSPSQPPPSHSTTTPNPHLLSLKTSTSLTPHRIPDLSVTGLSNTSGRSSSPLSNISSSSSLDLTKLVCSWDNCQQ